MCHFSLNKLNCFSAVAAPLQVCERVEENLQLQDEDSGEELHPSGDLPEGLQDLGEQMEDRSEEEIPPGTSPPQVPPKLLPQLSGGDGERLVCHTQWKCFTEWLYEACFCSVWSTDEEQMKNWWRTEQ